MAPAEVAGSNVEEAAGVLVGEREVAKRDDHHVRKGRCFGRQLMEANLPADVIAVLGASALRQDNKPLSYVRPRVLSQNPSLNGKRFGDRGMNERHLSADAKPTSVGVEG